MKYGISGAVTGGVAAGVDGQHVGRGIVQGTLTGAIGGAALGAVNVGLFGPAYVPDQSYGDYGNYGPVYRRGTFITRALAGEGSGVALGRNLITQEFKGNPTYYGRTYDGAHANNFLRAHETAHYNQQIKLGFAGFYGRTASQYIRLGPLNTYNTFGTLEMMANRYAYMRFGNQFKLIK